jgi:NAD(P)-dependent dehydrogenase (short-subunit alcohol dehydrogenase family)
LHTYCCTFCQQSIALDHIYQISLICDLVAIPHRRQHMTNASPTIALITGAGRKNGIGYAVARQLAERGIKVLLTARKIEDARTRARELANDGFDVTGFALDITDLKSVSELAAEVKDSFAKLDILVNNAAATTAYGETAAQADLKNAEATLATTLFGTWRLTQAFLPLLRDSKHARIVNVSSGAGSHVDTAFGLSTSNGMGPSYAIAKAALNALTHKLATEEKHSGMLINAVCPGFTATFEGGEAMGARPVKDGAASVIWACTIPDDGPTGGFFRDGKPLGW